MPGIITTIHTVLQDTLYYLPAEAYALGWQPEGLAQKLHAHVSAQQAQQAPASQQAQQALAPQQAQQVCTPGAHTCTSAGSYIPAGTAGHIQQHVC